MFSGIVLVVLCRLSCPLWREFLFSKELATRLESGRVRQFVQCAAASDDLHELSEAIYSNYNSEDSFFQRGDLPPEL